MHRQSTSSGGWYQTQHSTRRLVELQQGVQVTREFIISTETRHDGVQISLNNNHRVHQQHTGTCTLRCGVHVAAQISSSVTESLKNCSAMIVTVPSLSGISLNNNHGVLLVICAATCTSHLSVSVEIIAAGSSGICQRAGCCSRKKGVVGHAEQKPLASSSECFACRGPSKLSDQLPPLRSHRARERTTASASVSFRTYAVVHPCNRPVAGASATPTSSAAPAAPSPSTAGVVWGGAEDRSSDHGRPVVSVVRRRNLEPVRHHAGLACSAQPANK